MTKTLVIWCCLLILISHYNDPYQPMGIVECHQGCDRCSNAWFFCCPYEILYESLTYFHNHISTSFVSRLKKTPGATRGKNTVRYVGPSFGDTGTGLPDISCAKLFGRYSATRLLRSLWTLVNPLVEHLGECYGSPEIWRIPKQRKVFLGLLEGIHVFLMSKMIIFVYFRM